MLKITSERSRGADGVYTDREITIVRKSGYKSARTLDGGWNDINTDSYRSEVVGLTVPACANQLCNQLIGTGWNSEGTPNVLLEAMVRGLPCSDAGDVSNLIRTGPSGYWFELPIQKR